MLILSNISFHAKAKQWKGIKISGYVCANYTLSVLWIIHKCSEVSVKCHYEAIWQDFFFLPTSFSQFPLESVWLALLGLGNDVSTILRLLLGSTKHYRSYTNNDFLSSFLIWQLGFLALFYLRLDCISLKILTCIYNQ